MRKFIILTIIVGLFMGLSLVYSEPQIEISSYKLTPEKVYPGGSFTLTLTLKNNSSKDTAKNITIKINNIEGRADLGPFYPKNKTDTRKIEEIEPLEDKKVDFEFFVDPLTNTGIYRIHVLLTWFSEGRRTYSEEERISVDVSPPSMENKPLLTINSFTTQPEDIEGGDIFSLNLNIKNIGGKDATNVRVEITRIEGSNSLMFFSPYGGGNISYITLIGAGDSKSVSLKFLVDENIKSGNYNFIVELSYDDKNHVNYKDQEIVGIKVNEKTDKPDIEIISFKVEPDIILPGETFSITFKISNLGAKDAKNIRITPSNIEGSTSLKYFSPIREGTVYIEKLKSEDMIEKSILFGTDKKVEPSLYNIVFQIEYEDEEGNYFKDVKNIGILITSKLPDVYLSTFSLDKDTIQQGDEFNLILTVKNFGESSAKDVRITIQSIEGSNSLYPFSLLKGGGTIYIGNIEPKEEKKITFNLKVDEEAVTKTYNILFDINFKDLSLKDYSKIEKIGIYVLEKEENDEPNIILKNISVEPNVVTPEGKFQVKITLINSGGKTAKNTKFEFVSVGMSNDLAPFSPLQKGSTLYFGDMESGKEITKSITFSVSDNANDGVYNILTRIIYENSAIYKEEQRVGVVVSRKEPQKNLSLSISSFSVSPYEVSPGENIKVNVVVSNLSDETAYNVTLKIDRVEGSNNLFPFSPMNSSNINTYIKLLPRNAISSTYSFSVSPDADSGAYNLLLTMGYEDKEGNRYDNTASIGVTILRKPLISIFNLVYPDEVFENESFVISCDIGNTGNFSVRGIVVFLNGLPVKGGDYYIGTLDTGNFDTYEFEGKIKEKGIYHGEIVVQYVDDSNNIHKEKKDIEIKVVEKQNEKEEKVEKLNFWQKLWRFILSLFGLGK